MTGFPVPKLNNNDTTYVLVEWLAEDGQAVRDGDPVVLLETSKATEEVVAPRDGVLRRLLAEGAECEPGQVIAQLLGPGDEAAPEDPAGTVRSTGSAESAGGDPRGPGLPAAPGDSVPGVPVGPGGAGDGSGVVVTMPARELIEAHGVAMERVYALGRKVIRRADVEELLGAPARPSPTGSTAGTGITATSGGASGSDRPSAPGHVDGLSATAGSTPNGAGRAGFTLAEAAPDGAGRDDDAEWITLSRAQQRTAEVVERSRREIPAAFTVMSVDVTEVLSLARDLTRRLRALVGLPEMVVKATGGLLDRFPVFFAQPGPGPRPRLRRATAANVGVTVDVGRGLFIPVVRDVADRPLAEIARDLVDFRKTALTGSFRESDLEGGNITLTLHTSDGIVHAVPIVFPGQTCALSLTAPRPEVVPDGSGFAVRKTAAIGLAYDHRFVNGRDAAEFLGELRSALESPARFLTENG
ncbi:2-oxo acid dehydrogenase subunit E2 [Microbispora sp. H10670]|uniref:2-oxo acid dehydrogenase subunit E2 n=1 Tax=Microbispora sp. H10670 TaxID=2729108 RepID=UPI001601EDFB|nr:2-oxo acid dehydrogenase subunit E2 [Microbispora sp. H10670]